MTFDQFLGDLKSDSVWWTNATMYYKPETALAVANDLFMSCSADNSLHRPAGDMRRYYWNKLKKITPDKVRKTFELKPEPGPYHQPLTGEARQQKLDEWLRLVLSAPIMKPTPKLTSQQIEEEGGVRPKAVDPYPQTSPSEALNHAIHVEYIRCNYDARTKDPLPEWVPENEWEPDPEWLREWLKKNFQK